MTPVVTSSSGPPGRRYAGCKRRATMSTKMLLATALMIVLASGAVATTTACKNDLVAGPAERTVTVSLGEICGLVEDSPSREVHAECAYDAGDAGLAQCQILANSFRDSGFNVRLGVCSPRCHGDCPAGFSCVQDVRGNFTGNLPLCLPDCVHDSDCGGPFQFCVSKACQIQTCDESNACPTGGACSGGLCERGDAGP